MDPTLRMEKHNTRLWFYDDGTILVEVFNNFTNSYNGSEYNEVESYKLYEALKKYFEDKEE